MSLWCAGFPTITVAQGDRPKPVTLVLPYYENPAFLARQIGWWRTFPAHVKAHVSVIVADDGSPTRPARDVLAGVIAPFPLRLFRIHVDVRWNWLAARNIGAHHARDGWLLLTDIDHVLPATTAEALIYGTHDPSIVYAFSRIEHTGVPLAPHSASFFMTRQMFWRIGGYDEDLSGNYGTDGVYRKRLAQHAQIHILTDRLIRHEYQGDSSTPESYGRKGNPADAARKADVVRRKGNASPKVLSFPYTEIML